MLQWIDSLSAKSHIPSDQIKFILAFFIELPICFALRYLPNNHRIKHITYCGIGIIMLLFVFGISSMIVIIPAIISYVLMYYKRTFRMAFFVFSLNLIFLTILQIYKCYNYYLQWYLDVTTLQMIVVIKLGNFAFNVAKGHNPSEVRQTEYNKSHNIPSKDFPSVLEFLGYFLFFPANFSGPCVEYQVYRKFVSLELFDSYSDGSTENKTKKLPPIDWKQFSIVFGQSVLLFALTIAVTIVPLKKYFYEVVIDNAHSYYFYQRMLMVIIFIYSVVFRYFATWKMAECMGILFGFGYTGMVDDKPTWYGFRNVKLFDFFFSNSAKMVIDSWNIYVQTFMRNHIFEAFEIFGGIFNEYKQSLTNFTSAFWHGLYPGYYLSFGMLALHHDVSCAFHSRLEPLVEGRYGKKSIFYVIYWVLTFIYARIAITYSFIPFVILTFNDSWKFFINTYFCIDVIAVILLIILRYSFPKQQKKDKID